MVAESRYAAEDARELVDVEYEPLPSVQERSRRARRAVHDDIADNLAGRVTLRAATSRPRSRAAPPGGLPPPRIGRGGGQPMETRGLVADWNAAPGTHGVGLVAGAAPDPAVHLRSAGPGPAPGARAGARRGRRLRRQADRLSRGRAGPVPRAAPRPARALARGPPGAHADRHPGAHAGARGHVGFDDEGRLLALRDRFVHDTGPTHRAAWWCRCSAPRCWPGRTASPASR